MFAPLHGRNAGHGMQVVRRHDLHCIEILLLVEQLPVVGVRRTAFAGRGPIVGVHGVLADVPAAGDGSLAAGPPVWFAERLANRVEDLSAGPIVVADGILAGVANRHDPDFGDGEQRRQLAQCLCAHPDHRQGDLVAGGDVPLSSQYMAWDNRECNGAGCRAQELATVLIGLHAAPFNGYTSLGRPSGHSPPIRGPRQGQAVIQIGNGCWLHESS